MFNALLGWQNSATVGSVVSYNLYWVAVMVGFVTMVCREKGYWPFTAPAEEAEEPRDGNLQPLLGNRQAS